MQKIYNEMWLSYQRGKISQEVWLNFTDSIFEQLLTECEDVLIRLKNI